MHMTYPQVAYIRSGKSIRDQGTAGDKCMKHSQTNIPNILGKIQRPHCDLTAIMVDKGNHPQMAEKFRLVKYFNLPRIFTNYSQTIH